MKFKKNIRIYFNKIFGQILKIQPDDFQITKHAAKGFCACKIGADKAETNGAKCCQTEEFELLRGTVGILKASNADTAWACMKLSKATALFSSAWTELASRIELRPVCRGLRTQMNNTIVMNNN